MCPIVPQSAMRHPAATNERRLRRQELRRTVRVT
jgi:hypothetical protein